MRETSYKCDRCGKPVAAWAVTKINMNMQKGKEPVEKKPFDFCSECFLHVKSAFRRHPGLIGARESRGGSPG